MNTFLIIFASLIAFSQVNSQTIRYVCRFRNFSVESENAYLVDMKLNKDKNEDTMESTVNVTKDFYIKSIEVVVYRCVFENFDCENFQRWKFNRDLKNIVYMKNQIWSPMVDSITPKVGVPKVKKDIYRAKGATMDATALIRFYPEAVKYFWRPEVIFQDYNDKKAAVVKFDLSVFSYVERRRKTDKRK